MLITYNMINAIATNHQKWTDRRDRWEYLFSQYRTTKNNNSHYIDSNIIIKNVPRHCTDLIVRVCEYLWNFPCHKVYISKLYYVRYLIHNIMK